MRFNSISDFKKSFFIEYNYLSDLYAYILRVCSPEMIEKVIRERAQDINLLIEKYQEFI